jgi:hypothetical protein
MQGSPELSAPAAPADAWEEVVTDVASAVEEVTPSAAEAVELADVAASVIDWPNRLELVELAGQLDPLVAALLIALGVAYLVFGYYLHRGVAIINAAALGATGGWYIGEQAGSGLAGSVLGGIIAGAVAWPAMKAIVSLSAAIVGFSLGCAAWRAGGWADPYAPAGGLIGAVFLSMLGLAFFRTGVTLAAALQGAVMLLAGVASFGLQYEPIADFLREQIADRPLALPVTLVALTAIGTLLQTGETKED